MLGFESGRIRAVFQQTVRKIGGSDSSEAILYVNGLPVDQESFVRNPASADWPFHIGSANAVPLLAPAGSFSDFRVYDTVLGSDEFLYWADLTGPAREENRDPDQDGVPNGLEFEYGANPLETDSDKDGVGDYEEIFGKVRENTDDAAPRVYSSPYLTDSDGDTLSDYIERHGSQPTNPMTADTDGDGFLDVEEPNLEYLDAAGQPDHPDPREFDTDRDGMSDFDEVRNRRNPVRNPDLVNPFPPPGVMFNTDTDGDGLTDFSEHYEYGTDPNLKDTFEDGIGDYDRVSFGLIGPIGNIFSDGLFAANGDYDNDGVWNADEIKSGSNPMQASNMGAPLVRPKTLEEIPEISESQAKAEGSDFVWASVVRRIFLPDNAKAWVMQASGGSDDWIVLNTLELSGRRPNGEDVATKLDGAGAETDSGWKHVGKSPTVAYGSKPPQEISGFINELDRDADGYVTLIVKNIATHPVKPDPGVPDDNGQTWVPDLGFMGSNGSGAGLGIGLGGPGGGGVFNPWVDVLKILQPEFGEEPQAKPQKPFPVYGSTAVALKVLAVDIDGRSAGATGPFMNEIKEAASAAVVSPTDVSQSPANADKAARIRIYPTGSEGGVRRLQWSESLHLFYNNSYLQRTETGYEIPESANTVEMLVFSDVNSPSGGIISLAGFEANGNVIGSDSVNFTDVPVQVGVFPDEVTYVSADTPEDTILFSVDTLEENSETSALEMTPVEDGSTVGIKVKKGADGTWQDKGEIHTEGGIATYRINTSTNDKDTYYVKAYVKSINRTGGEVLSYGDAAKDLGEANGDPANRHSSLIGFSEKIEVVPGIPTAPNFNLDPLEYPADGESEMLVTATPEDANGNLLRPGTSVTWSMDGYGLLKESDSEINEGGATTATLLSKEKRTDEFFQSAFLQTSNPVPFNQEVGNLKMSATATSSAGDVVIGGGAVEVEATFTAEGGAELEGRNVVWYCSNGKFTYDARSTQLDANGKARIWVNGNGANVGQGIVFAQAGTAAAKVVLNYMVMPGTVSLRIKDPLLAAGTASAASDVEITGPPGAVVEIGFAGAWAMDSNVPVSGSRYGPMGPEGYGGKPAKQLFILEGLNANGEVQLDETGKRTFSVRANSLPGSSNPDFAALADVALVGKVKSVPSGQDVSSFHVHPGRIVSMPDKVLNATLDVLKGFVWGDSSNLTQAGGELALAMIPYGGGVGDCRDMVREVCRWIMPGGKNADWTNFNLALVSLVSELIPGGGSVSSAVIAPVKIALTWIKKLAVPISLVVTYREELLEFLNFTGRVLGNYIANSDLAGAMRFVEENGIVELLDFIGHFATESGLMASNTLPGPGNSALLYTVSTGTVSDQFRKVVKGLAKVAKDKNGLFELGKVLKKFDNADFRHRLGGYLTEISEQTLESGGRSGAAIAKKMFLVLNSSKFPKELADMLQKAEPHQHAADFIADMATVFAKTNLHSRDMLKILQMKLIYDPTMLRAGSPASVMTIGQIMEDMATVSKRHGPEGAMVIKGLAKYADDAVAGTGNISNSSWNWFGPIIHGRRAELEYLAKNADAKPGTHVTFEVVKSGKLAKIVSDVDAFKGGAAISIKRQGKTLDEWARPGEKRDEWLAAYMRKIKTGLSVDGKVVLPSSDKIVFLTGKELPSEATQKRLKKIGEKIFGKNNVVFEVLPILPPPAIN